MTKVLLLEIIMNLIIQILRLQLKPKTGYDSFIGWRKCSWKAGEGDVAEVLKYTWQVSGAKVQYRKKG